MEAGEEAHRAGRTVLAGVERRGAFRGHGAGRRHQLSGQFQRLEVLSGQIVFERDPFAAEAGLLNVGVVVAGLVVVAVQTLPPFAVTAFLLLRSRASGAKGVHVAEGGWMVWVTW